MTDTPSSLRQRAAGLAASALVFASILLTPATALAAGGPGTPPDLFPDVITTTEETPATGNVLDNDVNSSGVVPFTVTTYTQPAASVGTLVIAANGDYTFTPAPNFSGSGSATYMASNTKHEVGPATITINVSNTQDPPSAGDDNVTVVEDTATNVKAAILANDSDPDGDTISVTGASNATGGSVSLAGGTVTFTPTGELCGNGAGSFDYDIAATGGTDSAHVTVDITCVDDAPVATNDNASGTEDQDVVIDEATLVGNDSDPEDDSLSVSAVSNPSGGSVSRAGGQVTFTPDADLCGDNSASFDYTLSDGNGGTDTGTVTIDLECTADAPVAHNDTASGTEDQDVVIDAGDLAGNDTDADGDTLTVTAVSNPSGGTVALLAGTVTFTPAANLCGDASASFDYTVDDGNGGTDTGTVTIDLGCENDNPVANDDTVSADEDTATDVTAAVLSNDTDVDGDTLVVSDADNATGGTVDLTGGVVTFTPDAGQCGDGLGSFDYEVSDGNGGTDEGHAIVDVTCANDAPVATDDGVSGTEDQDVVIDGGDLTGNDNDGDGNALTVSAVTNPSGGTVVLVGTTITFTPTAELCGDDVASFDYTVDDGNGGTDTGTVTIDLECVNDNPVADDDTASGTEDQDVVVTASTSRPTTPTSRATPCRSRPSPTPRAERSSLARGHHHVHPGRRRVRRRLRLVRLHGRRRQRRHRHRHRADRSRVRRTTTRSPRTTPPRAPRTRTSPSRPTTSSRTTPTSTTATRCRSTASATRPAAPCRSSRAPSPSPRTRTCAATPRPPSTTPWSTTTAARTRAPSGSTSSAPTTARPRWTTPLRAPRTRTSASTPAT